VKRSQLTFCPPKMIHLAILSSKQSSCFVLFGGVWFFVFDYAFFVCVFCDIEWETFVFDFDGEFWRRFTVDEFGR
jgi:hypothetical protein